MFLSRIAALVLAFLVTACSLEPPAPKTRAEAFEWLRSNWSTAERSALRIAALCSKRDGDFTIGGNGISSDGTLPMEHSELFTREMTLARVSLVRCMEHSVLLHVGSGFDGTVQFDGAYQFSPSGFPTAPRCEGLDFAAASAHGCAEELSDGWYITVLWHALD